MGVIVLNTKMQNEHFKINWALGRTSADILNFDSLFREKKQKWKMKKQEALQKKSSALARRAVQAIKMCKHLTNFL